MRRTLLLLAGALIAILLLTAMRPAAQAPGAKPSLAERLGFKASDIVLIVNADDVGMSHGANVAVRTGMEQGLITSGSIMVPCPWFEEVAVYATANPTRDFGLHLTHTSEWKVYKWGPVANKAEVPGLLTPQGYLWPDIEPIYKNATPAQAEIEARAQVRKALDRGIDVTHLDSHMGALQYDMRYHAVYRKLAKEFDLPIRMGNQDLLTAMGGGHLRGELDADGTIYPDYLIHQQRKPGEAVDVYWKRMISELKPGVTELYIHPAVAGEEMQHITGSWKERDSEYHLFTDDASVKQLLEQRGVKRIGWRALRDLQRK
ncbi:polysaccharide deacetylase family protein [Luteitalea pratensis]|nr:polysaccharide deacetylase family protein [Luteitalea pratensis]